VPTEVDDVTTTRRDPTGRTAIVTGASRGIGRQIALALAARGANVVVAARSVEAHRRLTGSIGETVSTIEAGGGRAIGMRTDMTVASDLGDLVARTVDVFGSIDILVNNAADTSGGTADLAGLDYDEWRRQFDANLHGPLLLMKAVAPLMEQAGGGVIINMTSGAGDLVAGPPTAATGLGERLAYAATKAALNRLANALAPELKRMGIAIVNVDPGFTRTELVDLMGARGLVDAEAAVPMEIPVRAVLHLISGDHAGPLTGTIVRASDYVGRLDLGR
jgi:NAD(P)-dependent dehydrogenase (short-subunit alcohol dehydrogenase family)